MRMRIGRDSRPDRRDELNQYVMNNAVNIVFLDQYTVNHTDLTPIEVLGHYTGYDITPAELIVERCHEADVVIANKTPLMGDTLRALPRLKLICVAATGMNNVDLETAKAQNVVVKNVVGYSTYAVAQHTLMLALSFLGQLPYYNNYVQSGKWTKSKIFCHLGQEINDLYGKEWGIIGFGNIGKQVCKLAQSFGANISYHSTSGNNTQAQIPHKSLDSLLSTSDIISIHAPLNSHTHNLITKRQLQKLKKGAILLNLGRGGIVNERDLAEQLHQQDFYFGTDVLEKEPMIENHPLLDSNIAHKIIITPHIAWAYKDTKERLLQLVAKNIESFIQSCHT